LDFFEALLTLGTGGTCWAGNGALHDLLQALGFGVERAIATMLHSPDLAEPNHGSVVVTLGGVRYVTDASILSGEPLELSASVPDAPLPRVEMRGETPFIVWRTLPFPDGMPCRFEKIGVGAAEWHERHQRTATWSPFNFGVAARTNRPGRVVGLGVSRRFEFSEEGRLSAEPVDRAARDRFLTDELGISPALVRALPDDRPIAPRPVPT
jgi:N-hydroxyarylamine O-acetyltransferase